MNRRLLLLCVIVAGLSLHALAEDNGHGSSAPPHPYPSHPIIEDATPVPTDDKDALVPPGNEKADTAAVQAIVPDEVARDLDAALRDMMMLSRGESGGIQTIWEARPVGEWSNPFPEIYPATLTTIR